VHGPMDHWLDFGAQSMVDPRQDYWPELAGARLADVLVRGTLPRRRGKQEEGTGISTLVGTRRWWGSDCQAMVEVRMEGSSGHGVERWRWGHVL
jgi:hypothetical protein